MRLVVQPPDAVLRFCLTSLFMQFVLTARSPSHRQDVVLSMAK